MARASFTLRKTSAEAGSYLQYPIGDPAYASREDNDNYLRADTLQLVPTVSPVVQGLYIEALCVDYDTVVVNWNVLLESTLGASPVAYEVIIKYGSEGNPRTINRGVTVVETTASGTGEITYVVNPDNRWAYFTLFIHYLSTAGDDYYEPVAQVKVFVPKDNGSTSALFNRIPEYYRLMDDLQDGDSGGPLRKFLSVFGWGLDHHKSLIDYLISMKDPQVADQEVLDTLSRDFGVGLLSADLGTGRLRKYLDSIGEIRRGKGTLEIVERTLKALTECNVEYDSSASPVPSIKVYAQRVNLVSDPRVVTGIVGSLDGGSPSSTYTAGYTLDSGVVGDPQTDGDYDGGDSVEPSYSGSSSLTGGWSTYPDALNTGYSILERSTFDIKVIGGDVLYFSMHVDAPIQNLLQDVMLYEIGGYSELTGVQVAVSATPTSVGTTQYWRIEIPDTYTSYTDTKLVIRFADSPAYGADSFGYMLLERNTVGEYFDGDTTRGGWIVDGSGAVSDFAWVGTEGESQSVYTDNIQKVKYTINRLIQSILPVTQLVTTGTVYSNRTATTNLNYDITWNNIPGV